MSSSSPAPPPRLTFTSFPREIRDEIYANLLIYHTKIYIRASDTGTSFKFLKRHLPYSLLLNHQIMQEASMVFFERATVIFEGTRLLMLKKFLDQFPEEAAWKSIRELDFNGHEYGTRYAKPVGSKTGTMPYTSVHDIAIRCSGLKILSMAFSPNIYATPRDPMITALTPHEIEQKTNLLRVLENRNLVHLTLRFDASRHQTMYEDLNTDWEELFAGCTAVLEEEIAKQGRRVEVERNVKLPSKPVYSSGYSWSQAYYGGIGHPLDWK